jgi:peptide/nickel transport system substrate-binding protein
VTINLKVYGTDTEYYADAVFGKSPWLDSVMGITDYGHRPVPNVYLSSVYTSKGTWNAAHFKNAQADQLIADYIGALDLDSQRTAAKKIQELLLDETPVVIPYFYNFLSAATPNLKNAVSAATGQFDLSKAGFTS